MTDALLLALTAGIAWGMWAALERWGDVAGRWMLALGYELARELGYSG